MSVGYGGHVDPVRVDDVTAQLLFHHVAAGGVFVAPRRRPRGGGGSRRDVDLSLIHI